MEANWVLKSIYKYEENAIREAFVNLLGLENVQVEDSPAVAAALELTASGIELADALHLSSRPPAVEFVSFDKAFVRRAGRAGASRVRHL